MLQVNINVVIGHPAYKLQGTRRAVAILTRRHARKDMNYVRVSQIGHPTRAYLALSYPCASPRLRQGASGKAVLKQPLIEEACVPKRPSYASDLRDAALAAASYPLGDVVTSDVQFTFNRGYACEVNGDVYSYPDLNPLLMPLGKVVQWSFNDVRRLGDAQCS
jgi:hypothetical protein